MVFKNDQELSVIVKRIAGNEDRSAFERLFLCFSKRLLAYAFSIVKEEAASEDILQDVFVKLWENRDSLSRVDNITYYLFKAVKNTSLNYLSSKGKNTLHFEEIPDSPWPLEVSNPAEIFISKQHVEIINKAISQLPGRSRLLLQLIKIQGLKYQEAADLLDISVKTVETHMTAAYSQLINTIEQLLPEYGKLYHYKRLKK